MNEKELLKSIETYIKAYETGPTGREVNGTVELLKKLYQYIQKLIGFSKNELPKEASEVYLILQSKYNNFTEYSVGIYVYVENDWYWQDYKYGWLEWDKYSDNHGGCSIYKVIAWKLI